MKKYTLYLLLAALTGLFASCSRDENPAQTSENNQVRIGASIDGALRTRAWEALTIPEGYKLRYVLEVYSSEEVLVQKYEQTAADANSVNFDFKLADAGTYYTVMWADFVTDETGTTVNATDRLNEYIHYADKHYKTTDNLKQVGVITTGYAINDESRDAFCGSRSIKKDVGALTASITLTRPFGQINVIEKNADLLAKVQSMSLTYTVPASFNVKTGTVTGSAEVKPTVSTSLPTAADARKANLFYDFIFAPATGQTTLDEIAMTFECNDPTVILNDFSIPANMPVVRNKRTNISGSILHTSDAPNDAASLSVGISNGWTETTTDEEKDIDPNVGDYYYKDGTWSTELKATTENPVIGVVYELSTHGKSRGSVVSLTEPTGLAWSTENEETGATLYNDGQGNTAKVFAYITANNKGIASYPVFQALQEHRDNTGNDGWYILVNYDIFFADESAVANAINGKITAAGGVELVAPTAKADGYWTSYEHNANDAFIQNSYRTRGNETKSKPHKVRFVLDF